MTISKVLDDVTIFSKYKTNINIEIFLTSYVLAKQSIISLPKRIVTVMFCQNKVLKHSFLTISLHLNINIQLLWKPVSILNKNIPISKNISRGIEHLLLLT